MTKNIGVVDFFVAEYIASAARVLKIRSATVVRYVTVAVTPEAPVGLGRENPHSALLQPTRTVTTCWPDFRAQIPVTATSALMEVTTARQPKQILLRGWHRVLLFMRKHHEEVEDLEQHRVDQFCDPTAPRTEFFGDGAVTCSSGAAPRVGRRRVSSSWR